MRELITRNWNWNNGTDFANWMTKQVAFKVLSEFWCWYQVNLVLTSFLSMTLRQNKDNNIVEIL